MDEPYSESELESLDAHEQQDALATLGYYDDGNEPNPPSVCLVWPMEFGPNARISE